MQWTKEMEQMVKDADVKITGKSVLWYTDSAVVKASDELQKLTKAVAAKARIDCNCRAVMTKCRRLRKDTTMTHESVAPAALSAHQVEAQEPAQPVEPVAPMPKKMKWTSELCQMLEEADVFDINGERMLQINGTGTQGNFPMEMLKNEVQMASKQKLSVLAVNQKMCRLRKRRHTDETVEAQEPVEPVEEQVPVPRPVTGGKGIRVRRMLRRRARRAEEQEVEGQVLTTNTEQVAPVLGAPVFKNREEKRAAARIEKASKVLEPGAMNTGPWSDTDIAKVAAWRYDNQNDLSNRNFFTPKLEALAELLKRPKRATFDKVCAARKEEDERSSGDVMPQVPVANEMVAESQYFDEQQQQPEAEQPRYTKTQEEEFLKSMRIRLCEMSRSNGAAAAFEAPRAPDFVEVLARGDVAFPGMLFVEMPLTSDVGFEDETFDFAASLVQDVATLQVAQASAAAGPSNSTAATYAPTPEDNDCWVRQQLLALIPRQANQAATAAPATQAPFPSSFAEFMEMVQASQASEAAAAAGSRARQMSPSNGAAATAAPAALRQMSPSNGAAATAVNDAPRMLDLEKMTKKHMCYVFGVDESKVPRDEAINKLRSTLKCLHDMVEQGVISVTVGSELSIFGVTTIVVNKQDEWIEMMTSCAKEYTIEFYKETKIYPSAIYHILNMLGFSGVDKNDVAWRKAGGHKPHCSFHSWHYQEETFRKNSPRFLQR